MQSRQRWFLSVMVTALIVGSGGLVWATRTGQLTIFGDQAPLVTTDLAVTDPIDLAKGVSAGDGNLINTDQGIGLATSARSGNAVFTVGQREIVKLYRIVPNLPATIPPGTDLSLVVAGSVDGVSFNDFSPSQPITPSGLDDGKGNPINLDFLIPADSRFVRIKVILSRTDPSNDPIFGGFVLNYGIPRPATTGLADQSNVLVNGSAIDTAAGTPPPNPGKPENLVVTGIESWSWALAGLWLVAMVLIFRLPTQRRPATEGAHGRTDTPIH